MWINIAEYLTMRLPARVEVLHKVSSREDLIGAIEEAQHRNLPPFILGGGSNTIFSDKDHPLYILKIENLGIRTEEAGDHVLLHASAGEKWDDVVRFAVDEKLSGIEALSAIPGTVGAAPVQNIGAYGTEVKDSIVEVEAFDIEKGEFKIFSNEACLFSYRNSLFKEKPGAYVIWSVTLKLGRQEHVAIPNYKDVVSYFEARGITNPTLQEVRDAIIEIRSKKLPDPVTVANCGSFFKNPFIKNDQAAALKETYPEIPVFQINSQTSKLAAGWLIEKAGFKGYGNKGIGTYEHNALVIVNRGTGTFEELTKLRNIIKEKVWDMFGVKLEEEVNIV